MRLHRFSLALTFVYFKSVKRLLSEMYLLTAETIFDNFCFGSWHHTLFFKFYRIRCASSHGQLIWCGWYQLLGVSTPFKWWNHFILSIFISISIWNVMTNSNGMNHFIHTWVLILNHGRCLRPETLQEALHHREHQRYFLMTIVIAFVTVKLTNLIDSYLPLWMALVSLTLEN